VTSTGSILVVEDHELLAQTLTVALVAEGLDARAVACSSPAQLLADVDVARPALVLLDLDLGEGLGDGTCLIEPLVARGCAVLLVTACTDPVRIAVAVEAGAAGHVHKSCPLDELLADVREVLSGRSVLPDAVLLDLMSHLRRHRLDEESRLRPFARLSPREQQVLRALAEGQSVGAIAELWVVSPATVRSQVRGVLTKLGVGTQLAAVALARRSRWLDPGPSGQ
jgi:DNA-binding NarL/FixJ family response regulator